MTERRSHMTLRTCAWLTNTAYQHITGDVLDVGAGDAPYKRLFEPYVKSWTTLDARPCADIEADFDAPLPRAEYDTVLCTDALQFSRDPRTAVQNMADVLKRGGTLIITAPNCWHEDTISRWRFTLGGLGELVADAGLTVRYLDGLTGLWEMEGNRANMVGEYSMAIPATFRGFMAACDKDYPMITAVIASKE